MPETMDAMKDIFKECQRGIQGHGQLVKKLQKIQSSIGQDEFFEQFQHLCMYPMIIYKREPAVERCIEFIAKFSTAPPANPKKKDNIEEGDDKSDSSEESEFLNRFMDFLLKSHKACSHAVRFRVCQLINKLLHNMGDDAQIDDDLYDSIYAAMLERMRDKFPLVRAQAVLSLSRLQDPADKDCPIINAYLFLLSCDPNLDVRRAVLQSIAASTKTLPAILERTRDVKESVRKLAYSVIADKVHIKALTIAQRIKLLKHGLNDRSEVVRDACTIKMLQAWLRIFAGNILELLRCLDVEDAESMKTTELSLQTMFKKSQPAQLVNDFDLVDASLVIPFENLTCESVFYWRCLSDFIRDGESADELVDKIVPTLTAYCQYVGKYAELYKQESDLDNRLEQEYILQQLLLLAGVLDLSDEVGRKELEKLIHALLVSETVNYTIVKPLINLLIKMKKDDKTMIQYLVEVIADIREPITTIETFISGEDQRRLDIKIASLRVKLNELREELDNSIKEQEFGRASLLKEQIFQLEEEKEKMIEDGKPQSQEVRTEKNDPQTMLKCLTITAEMLLEVTLTNLTPALQTLIEVLIIPGIQNADPAVRNVAVKSLGLCCQMSKITARAHFLLFIQIATVDTVTIQVSALIAIIDMLLTFGLEAFDAGEDENRSNGREYDDEDDDIQSVHSNMSGSSTDDFVGSGQKPVSKNGTKPSVNSLVTILTSLLDSEISEMRTVAAEGLAKLLISGRMVSAKLLSRLILLWYNPTTEDDIHLRHCLGTFLPEFAFSCRANQELIEEAFMSTLKTIFNAPVFSPLSTVNAGNVADLLVQLTSTRHLVENNNNHVTVDTQDCSLHSSLAIKVCNEILNEPNSFNVRTLARILGTLQLNETCETDIRDIHSMNEQIVDAVKDKNCLKTLEKFQRAVNALVANLPLKENEAEMTAPVSDTITDETKNQEMMTVEEVPATDQNNSKPVDAKKKPVRKGKKTLLSLAEQSMDCSAFADTSQLEDTVFASPSPVRQRSARTRRTNATPNSSLASESMKRNLEKMLEEEVELSEKQGTLKEKN